MVMVGSGCVQADVDLHTYTYVRTLIAMVMVGSGCVQADVDLHTYVHVATRQ